MVGEPGQGLPMQSLTLVNGGGPVGLTWRLHCPHCGSSTLYADPFWGMPSTVLGCICCKESFPVARAGIRGTAY